MVKPAYSLLIKHCVWEIKNIVVGITISYFTEVNIYHCSTKFARNVGSITDKLFTQTFWEATFSTVFPFNAFALAIIYDWVVMIVITFVIVRVYMVIQAIIKRPYMMRF